MTLLASIESFLGSIWFATAAFLLGAFIGAPLLNLAVKKIKGVK